MTTIADVKAFLLGDNELSGLIGLRLYPVTLPQKPTTPCITYQIITGNRAMTWSGPVHFVNHRVQLDCWSSTYAQVQEVADALRKRLNGYSGIVGDGTMQGAIFMTERDLYEPDAELFRRLTEYQIWLTDDL